MESMKNNWKGQPIPVCRALFVPIVLRHCLSLRSSIFKYPVIMTMFVFTDLSIMTGHQDRSIDNDCVTV